MSDYETSMPPQSLEAEAAILGAMFLSVSAACHAFGQLEAEDFYRPRHRQLFEVMRDLAAEGAAIDIVVLKDYLRRKGLLDQVGGSAFLAELVNIVPTAANAEHYIKIVVEKSVLRRLATAGQSMVGDVHGSQDYSEEIATRALDEVLRATERRNGKGPRKVGEILSEVLQRLESGELKIGLKCDLRAIHEQIGSFKPGQLILIAARPSVGKSALARKMACDFARDGGTVLFFSLEESEQQVSLKILSAESRRDHAALEANKLGDDDWKEVVAAANEIHRWPLLIDDEAGITMLDLHFRCKELIAKGHRIKAVFMDYLQLASVPKGVAESTEREVAWSSLQAKNLARQLPVPVFLLSQLSRAPEKRSDHRPQLADLRYSGSLEQDADVVLLLYRHEQILERAARDVAECQQGIIEVIVAKQRSGGTGKVLVRLIKKTMGISDISGEEAREYIASTKKAKR